MKFNEYVKMLLESNLDEASRIDKELEKGPINYDGNKITGVERKRSDDRNWKGSKEYKGLRNNFGNFTFELDKASNHTFKEYLDGLSRLIKNVKEIKSLITGRETDKEIQKIWSLVDDINHSDYSFKGFVTDMGTAIQDKLGKEGFGPDIKELVTEFVWDSSISFTDLRDSLSELGLSPENIKEFMKSSSYTKIVAMRNFSKKMDALQSVVDQASRYAATKKNIERLSTNLKTLESEATSLMSQLTK
jgi:soluble cytochrome b562